VATFNKLKYATPRIDCGSKHTAFQKDIINYKVESFILHDKWEISGAKCTCPAGKGPAAACKYIGALRYLFQSFCENETMPEFFTSTQRLQEWGQPRPRKLDARPVTDRKEHRINIMSSL